MNEKIYGSSNDVFIESGIRLILEVNIPVTSCKQHIQLFLHTTTEVIYNLKRNLRAVNQK